MASAHMRDEFLRHGLLSADQRGLIQGHQQRIDRLKDNQEAAEIVAYDRDAVDRLEKRIAQIAEEEAAKAEAAEAAAKAAKQAEPESKPQREREGRAGLLPFLSSLFSDPCLHGFADTLAGRGEASERP